MSSSQLLAIVNNFFADLRYYIKLMLYNIPLYISDNQQNNKKPTEQQQKILYFRHNL